MAFVEEVRNATDTCSPYERKRYADEADCPVRARLQKCVKGVFRPAGQI